VTPTFHLYLDDSGARHLDYVPKQPGQPDWFALGGVMITEEDEDQFRKAHDAFCKRWSITEPLHSVRIRHRARQFAWLDQIEEGKRQQFFADLTDLIVTAPVLGIACVIDRPGYDARYRAKYGQRRWALCKTAFSIATERAAKYANMNGRRLKVFVEKADRQSDEKIRDHYDEIRSGGMPFNSETSSKYGPLTPDVLQHVLWDLKFKTKSSPLIQLADLYLYPLCRAGYEESYRPYQLLKEHGKTVDCVLPPDAVSQAGVKYSCFDFKNTKGEDCSSPSSASIIGNLVGSARKQ
jgi:hypothetical protein